jgi:hypothetical protein
MKIRLVLILLLFVDVASAKVVDTVLNVPVRMQDTTNWCWAACSQCVLKYTGMEINQCEIVEYERTQAPSWFGANNCCASRAPQSCNKTNSLYRDTAVSVKKTLWHFGKLKTDTLNTYLSTGKIDSELANGRPFIILLVTEATVGKKIVSQHMVVVYGKRDDLLYIMDPDPRYGAREITYKELVRHGKRLWVYTLMTSR